MKKRKFFLTVLLAHSLSLSFAQSTAAYIGSADKSEVALKGKIDLKGNTVVVGYSSNLEPDIAVYDYKHTDMLIVKLDDKGNLLWSRTLGGDNNLEDMFHSLDFTAEGDIIAVGTSERVPASFSYTGVYSKASIYKFDGNTGNIIWSRHVSIDNFNSVPSRRGDIYLDVKVLPGGNIVASGEKDFSPSYSDGIITLFDPGGNILKSKVYELPGNTNGLWHVDYDDAYIYVTGNHQGSSYMDMSVTQLDHSLNTVWNKNYDFSYLANNSQHMKGIISHTDTSFIVNTLIDLNWGGTGPSYTALTTIRKSDGSVISNFVVLNSGASVQGLPSFHVSQNNNYYLVNNPTTAFYNFYFPNYGAPGAVAFDYMLNVNGDNPITNMIDGSQIINSIDVDVKENVMMSGTSKNGQRQLGKYDIFVQRLARKGLGFRSRCIMDKEDVVWHAIPTTVITPTGFFEDVAWAFVPVMHKIERTIDVFNICEEEADFSATHNTQIEEMYNIGIYPNPVDNNLNINLDGWESDLVVSVFDIHGRRVYENHYKNNKANTIIISTKDFIGGNYVVQLNDNKGHLVSRIFTKY